MSKEKCFQSVFDDNVKFEKEMDVMFDADEDFDAFDVACGLKEDGSVNLPDAEELHQTEHDGVTPNDLRDELGEGHDTDNKPTADSCGEFDIEDEELDLACPKTGVADAVEVKPTVDPEDIESASDKAAEKMEKSFDEALDSLMREADEILGSEDEGKDGDLDLDNDDIEEAGCKTKKENAEDLADDSKPEDRDGSKDDTTPKSLVDELEDEESDSDDIKGTPEGEKDKPLVDGLEEEAEDLGVEDKDLGAEDKDLGVDKKDEPQEQIQDNPEEVGLDESKKSLVDELEDDDDDIIDEVEKQDKPMTDKEVKDLADVYDDDLIDAVAGKN